MMNSAGEFMSRPLFSLLKVIIALVLSAGPFLKAYADPPDKVYEIAGDSPAREKLISERREAIFKDVKAINIIVCLHTQGAVPDWFASDTLAQDAINYIHSGAHAISFSSDAQREPQRQKCNAGPFLFDPGNINFIILATTSTIELSPGKSFVLASISRVIYRPDHSGSVSGFLQTPIHINLSAPNARRGYDMFFKNNWTIGAGLEGDFDIPLGDK